MTTFVQTTIDDHAFDYNTLTPETRAFVQQKTDELHGQLKRVAEGIISIGNNLLAVKKRLPHGEFLSWLQVEFDMTIRTAQRFMSVAEKFGDKNDTMSFLSPTILYELAAPSTPDTIVQEVIEGKIDPNLTAIREAKDALKQAQEAERKARLEVETLQQQLFQTTHSQSEANTRISHLTAQIEALQEEMKELSTPKIETREVRVTPPEVLAQLEQLQSKVIDLTRQRQSLSEKADRQAEELRQNYAEQRRIQREVEIHQNWRASIQTFNGSVNKVLSQWPLLSDTQIFDNDDWAYLAQAEETAHRFLQACQKLRRNTTEMIIDAGD